MEEVIGEMNRTKAAAEKVKKDFKAMKQLNDVRKTFSAFFFRLGSQASFQQALKNSLHWRMAKWHEFRRHIALRCKVQFQYHVCSEALRKISFQ